MEHEEKKDAILVLTSFPDQESARQLGKKLVSEQIIKCISVLPGAISTYEWKGKIEEENEVLALMKMPASCWSELKLLFQEHHPYEVPELLKLSVEAEGQYLQWLLKR